MQPPSSVAEATTREGPKLGRNRAQPLDFILIAPPIFQMRRRGVSRKGTSGRFLRSLLGALSATSFLPEAASAQSVTPPPRGVTSRNDFQTEAEAVSHCAGRPIVWVIASKRVYFVKGDAGYGTGSEGAYMCEDEARGDRNRPATGGRR
jgi:hypothetical protein